MKKFSGNSLYSNTPIQVSNITGNNFRKNHGNWRIYPTKINCNFCGNKIEISINHDSPYIICHDINCSHKGKRQRIFPIKKSFRLLDSRKEAGQTRSIKARQKRKKSIQNIMSGNFNLSLNI